ncbi:peptidase S8/S53 domain-containing protein [Syncephalis fuscata]|nr:peptidase S8/S53 domain-containing protein [Syncephalis fuscata]
MQYHFATLSLPCLLWATALIALILRCSAAPDNSRHPSALSATFQYNANVPDADASSVQNEQSNAHINRRSNYKQPSISPEGNILYDIGNGLIMQNTKSKIFFDVMMPHLTTGIVGKGINIGIIDSGVDYTHPALGGGFGPGYKVRYGYDFVGDAYDGTNDLNPSGDPMDCVGHGTMVAGIIGTQIGNYHGVAPGATLGAYKISGCKGAHAAHAIEPALKKAKKDGMHIVNTFLTYADDMIIISSVSGVSKGQPGIWNSDAPGIAPSVISVGAMEAPYKAVYAFRIFNPSITANIIRYANLCANKQSILGEYPLSIIPSVPNTDPCKVPQNANGKMVLVMSNQCDIQQLAAEAKTQSAAGLIVSKIASIAECSLPIIFVATASIQLILSLYIQTKGVLSTAFYMRTIAVPDPTQMTGASYLNWGPSLLLGLSPELLAPGYEMATTTNDKTERYKFMKGTSLATPYMAGLAALYLDNCFRSNIHPPNSIELRSIFQNTATPYMIPNSKLAGSVAHQGAGMANIQRAVSRKISASPSSIELGDRKETGDGSRQKSGAITITNLFTEEREFYITHLPSKSMHGFSVRSALQDVPITIDIYAEVKITPNRIKMKPGNTAVINIEFSIPESLAYKDHWVYSGYIITDTNPPNGVRPSDQAIHVPYLGLNGDISNIINWLST